MIDTLWIGLVLAKMRARALRAMAVTGIAILALLVLAYLVAISPPGQSWIARKIESQAKEFKIDVSIGKMRTNFFRSALLRNVRVAASDTSFKIEAASISLRLTPIRALRGGGLVSSATFIRPQLTFRSDSSIARPSLPGPPMLASSISRFVPDRIRLRRGRFTRVSDSGTTSIRLDTLDIIRRSDVADTVLSMNVKLAAIIASLDSLPMKLQGRVTWSFSNLSLDTLTLTAGSLRLGGTAKATTLRHGPFQASIEVSADLSGLPQELIVPDLSGVTHLSIDISGNPDVWQATARLNSPRINTPWGGADTLQAWALAKSSGNITAGLSGWFAGGRMDGRASINQRGSYDVSITIDSLNLHELGPTRRRGKRRSKSHLSGTLSLEARAAGLIGDSLRAARVTARLDSLVYGLTQYGDAQLNAKISRGVLTAKVKAIGAEVTAKGPFHFDRPLDLKVTARVKSLLDHLSTWDVDFITGSATMAGRLYGELLSPGGSVSGRINEGKIESVYLGRRTDFTADWELKKGLSVRAGSPDSSFLAVGTLRPDWSGLDTATVYVDNLHFRQLAGDYLDTLGIEGHATGSVSGSGGWLELNFQCEIVSDTVRWQGQPLGVFSASSSLSGTYLSAHLEDTYGSIQSDMEISLDGEAVSSLELVWSWLDLGPVLAGLYGRDLSQVSGVSSGDVALRWGPPVPTGFVAYGRLTDALISVGAATYGLDRPAILDLTANTVSLASPATLSSGYQRITVAGSLRRAGALDLTVQVDSLDLGHAAPFAGLDTELEGMMSAMVKVTGSARRPVLDSFFVRATSIMWKDLRVDSLGIRGRLVGRGAELTIDSTQIVVEGIHWGRLSINTLEARIEAENDTVHLVNLFGSFPSGQISGRASATFAALGLPSSKFQNSHYSFDMSAEDVEMAVPWNYRLGLLQYGHLLLDGRFRAEGGESTHEGFHAALDVNKLGLSSPGSERSFYAVKPFTVTLTNSGIWKVPTPAQLVFVNQKKIAGLLTFTDSGQGRYTLNASELDLNIAEGVWPHALLGDVYGTEGFGIGGVLDANFSFAPLGGGFESRFDARIIEPRYHDLAADSLILKGTADDSILFVSDGSLWVDGQPLNLRGSLPLVNQRDMDIAVWATELSIAPLVEAIASDLIAEDYYLLQPASRPVAGWSGRFAFDTVKMRRSNTTAREHSARAGTGSKAVRGKVTVDLHLGGRLSAPVVDGKIEIAEAYLRLADMERPLRLEHARILFDSSEAVLEPTTLIVRDGAPRSSLRDQISIKGSMNLITGQFDWEVGLNRPEITIVETDEIEFPRYLWFADSFAPVLERFRRQMIARVTPEGTLRWEGTLENSTLRGDLQLGGLRFAQNITVLDLLGPSTGLGLGEWVNTVTLDVGLVASDPVVVKNNLADLTIDGIIQISGKPLDPVLIGRLEVPRGGKVTYLRHDFRVEECIIIFDDPTERNPSISLKAVAKLTTPALNKGSAPTEWIVTLEVHGRVDDPLTELYAETANQSERLDNFGEVFLLLTLGITSDQLRQHARQQVVDAGKIVTQDLAMSQLSNALEGLTGLDRVTVTSDDILDPTTEKTIEIGQTVRVLNRPLTASVSRLVQGAPSSGSESSTTITAVRLVWTIVERGDDVPYVDTIAFVVTHREDADAQNKSKNNFSGDIRYRYRFR